MFAPQVDTYFKGVYGSPCSLGRRSEVTPQLVIPCTAIKVVKQGASFEAPWCHTREAGLLRQVHMREGSEDNGFVHEVAPNIE